MLNRLAPLPHGLWVLIETLLDLFQHVLMLPACDSTLHSGRAAMLERAVATCIRPVAPQLQPILLVRVVVFKLLAGRTAIDILVSEINEVLLAETALCLNAGCHRLWKRHNDARLVAGEDLLAAEVAAVGNGLELVEIGRASCRERGGMWGVWGC